LTVNKAQANLYVAQHDNAEVIAQLKMGDKLTPLANALGSQAWYLVQTQEGATGWIRGADVAGVENAGKVFKEAEYVPSYPTIEQERPAQTEVLLKKGTSVPIEIERNQIIVPVVLNRSVKTHMVMDTGASITLVSRALAKRLRLVSAQKLALTTAGGVVTANLARLGSVKLGNAEVHGLSVAVHDYNPNPRADGLLGLDFFSRFHTSIDTKNQRLIIAPR
jgi:predicted aspartyl protease